jgi:hypothetical protein
MHHSRLTSIVIDCAEADYEQGAAFWSAALGRSVEVRNERFSSLRGRLAGEGSPYLGFQRVPAPSARSISTSRPTTSQPRWRGSNGSAPREGADPQPRRDGGAVGPRLLRRAVAAPRLPAGAPQWP